MISFLVIQVKLGNIGIEDVPERYRARVQTAIEEEGS